MVVAKSNAFFMGFMFLALSQQKRPFRGTYHTVFNCWDSLAYYRPKVNKLQGVGKMGLVRPFAAIKKGP